MSDEKKPFAVARLTHANEWAVDYGNETDYAAAMQWEAESKAKRINAAVERERREAVVKELRDLARQDQLAGPWLNARAAKIEKGRTMTDTKKPLAERLLSKMQEEINWRNEDLVGKQNILVQTPNDEARDAVIIAMAVLLALYETMMVMQAEAARG